MIYDYFIAGILVRCNIPYSLHVMDESAPFIGKPGCWGMEPDLEFVLYPADGIEIPKEQGVCVGNTCHVEDCSGYSIYYYPGPGRDPHAKVFWPKDGSRKIICQYASNMVRMVDYSRNIVDLMCLTRLLLRHGGLLLHASLLDFNSKGILFTGPSGAGKSTQAELWKTYCNAEILNGDRAALRMTNGAWMAYGLPYAGTSGIYRNESVPVSAIVVLRQGQENSIRPLTLSEAIRYLYPELSLHRWDANFVAAGMELLTSLVSCVPVWILECRPDRQAVELVRSIIEKEVTP